jgi:hypothetical protein
LYNRVENLATLSTEARRKRPPSLPCLKADARSVVRRLFVLDLLPAEAPGLASEEVHERWPEQGGGPIRPSSRSFRRDLERQAQEGIIKLTGTGRKHDLFRYYCEEPAVSS